MNYAYIQREQVNYIWTEFWLVRLGLFKETIYYSKEVDREECLLEKYGLLCSENRSGL